MSRGHPKSPSTCEGVSGSSFYPPRTSLLFSLLSFRTPLAAVIRSLCVRPVDSGSESKLRLIPTNKSFSSWAEKNSHPRMMKLLLRASPVLMRRISFLSKKRSRPFSERRRKRASLVLWSRTLSSTKCKVKAILGFPNLKKRTLRSRSSSKKFSLLLLSLSSNKNSLRS